MLCCQRLGRHQPLQADSVLRMSAEPFGIHGIFLEARSRLTYCICGKLARLMRHSAWRSEQGKGRDRATVARSPGNDCSPRLLKWVSRARHLLSVRKGSLEVLDLEADFLEVRPQGGKMHLPLPIISLHNQEGSNPVVYGTWVWLGLFPVSVLRASPI